MKKVGPKGNVVGVVRNPAQVPALMELGVYNKVIVASATEPIAVLDAALAANDGKEYDISICCVNIENCEMSAILPVRDDRQRLHQGSCRNHPQRSPREREASQAL